MIKVRDDLTGRRFERLTVLNQTEDYVSPKGSRLARWTCRCDCGNLVDVLGNSLKNGRTKSCGCLNNEVRELNLKRDKYNLIGQKFGRLTVINRAEDYIINGKRYSQWKCLCDCGNTVTVKQSKLLQGRTKSCGCFRSEITSQRFSNDLTGKKFGKLTVLKRCGTYIDNNGNKSDSLWLCKCDCGNYVKVRNLYLTSGDTKSCGCLSSIGEANISGILTKNDICFDAQFHFDDLKSESGRYLYFDFAIYDCNGNLAFLIEYQGQQHYEEVGNIDFGKFQREVTDEMKRQYCEANNILLYEIKYDDDVEEAIEDILIEYDKY